MAQDCNDAICTSRRDMIKAGAAAATWGLFGLSLPNLLFMREAHGVTPDVTTKRYDAIIQCFMTGGPSQTDTWDPKADPTPVAGATAGEVGYVSPNNVFPTLSLGSNDIYGKPVWLTQNLQSLANLVNSDPTNYGIGVIRSMYHGNGAHAIAESFMNCMWQSPVGNLYPSTAASMNFLMQDQVAPPSGVGLASVVITDNQGVQPDDAKGSACPTALQVSGGQSTSQVVQMLSLPKDQTGNTTVTTAQYQRRAQLIQAIEQNFDNTRTDQNVKAWTAAWQQAQAITLPGKAAAAFNLTGVTQLPGGTGASTGDLSNLTLAQQLVLNGVPFVSVAIQGNDTHLNNMAGVTMNWGATIDPAFTQIAKNFKAAGKRVLCVFFGEFGRTPNTVRNPGTPASSPPDRDGRDHWPVGFSAGLLSIGQPAFKTTAVGNTGPDGMWTTTSSPGLVDTVYPGALGGLLYQVMGYPSTNPAYMVPNATGVNGSMGAPVDPQYQTAANGGSAWLAQKFGLG